MTRDFKKQYQWMKENKVFVSLGLMKSTDSDIIQFLEDRKKQGQARNALIKKALRDMMKAEGYRQEGEG